MLHPRYFCCYLHTLKLYTNLDMLFYEFWGPDWYSTCNWWTGNNVVAAWI